jgi:hypothetical protein
MTLTDSTSPESVRVDESPRLDPKGIRGQTPFRLQSEIE